MVIPENSDELNENLPFIDIQFLSIDDNLQCYDENEDCNAAIVAKIKSKHQALEEPNDSNAEDSVPVRQNNVLTDYSVILCNMVMTGVPCQH